MVEWIKVSMRETQEGGVRMERRIDELWPGTGFVRGAGFPLGTDAVLLADFAARGQVRRFADLGCGAGVILVLLAQAFPHARGFGLEIQPEAAATARENAGINGVADRCEIRCGDLRENADLPEAGSFDLVAANPPYFPVGSGYSAPEGSRRAAREERFCTLDEICRAAARLTRWGGRFCIVHRPERLSELFVTLTGHGLEPKRLRMVCRTAADAPSLVLIEAQRGAKPALTIEKPLALYNADGSDSDECRRIYHTKETTP